MVNSGFTRGEQAAAERRMILSYAPADRREGLAAVFALDDTLAAILQGTREPMVGQMRLTWWYDALAALDTRPPPAEPVLQALAGHVSPAVTGTRLAALVEGWEELLDPEPLDAASLRRFADARGAALFEAAGALLGAAPTDPLAAAGRGWALADLAVHVHDDRSRELATAMAAEELATATRRRWSRAARPLGALVHLARMDDSAGAARVARAVWHRLTGR